MHLKLTDFKTIMYVYRLLYKNLTQTANQKSITDIYIYKKRESKHNTTDSHQITRRKQKNNERKRQKQPQNNEQNGNKSISIYNYLKCKWIKLSNQKTLSD